MKRRKKIRIGVAIRVRPFLKYEKKQGHTSKIMKYDYKKQQISYFFSQPSKLSQFSRVSVKKTKYHKIY